MHTRANHKSARAAAAAAAAVQLAGTLAQAATALSNISQTAL